MQKHLFFSWCLVLATLCISATVSRLSAQSQECGTPEISVAQLHAILEQLPQASFNPQSSPWKVPIWFYHLRHTNGTSVYQNFDPVSTIGFLNQSFNGLFDFTICGTTDIDDDQYAVMDLSASSSDFGNLMTTIDNLNQPASDGCVRIFLTGNPGIILGTDFPSGYALNRLDFNADAAVFVGVTDFETWAHEIGHYFGLSHTFADLTTQYVHDENNPVTIGGVEYSCFQTGDGFCDTPADLEFCTFSPSNCNATPNCSTTDPLGTPYAPDPSLLMSYYSGCRTRFSNEQKQVMRTLYLTHPNYSAILNASPVECLLPKYGKIERSCVDVPSPADDFTPIAEVPVEVRDVNTSCNGLNNLTDANGNYLTEPCIFNTPLRKVLPSKNHSFETNGVNVADLLLIGQHILGAIPFLNPFQIIAADENKSGSVTTFDIVGIRKVILNPGGNDFIAGSWRYVPKLCTETQTFHDQFWGDEDPITPGAQINPFNAVFIDPFQGFTRNYNSAGPNLPNNDSWMDFVSLNTDDAPSHNEAAWSFTGIKVGDVNCSADVDGFQSPEDPDGSFASLPHLQLAANQIFTLQVKAIGSTPIGAWQLGVDFAEESLQILEVQPGNSGEVFSLENFGLTELVQGKFLALNFTENGTGTNLNNKTLFKIKMKALHPIANIGQYFHLENSVLAEKFFTIVGTEIEPLGLQLEVLSALGMVGGMGTGQNSIAQDAYSLSAYPVPFTSEVSFNFILHKDEQVRLSIFDSYGRLVVAHSEALSRGSNTLQINDLALQSAGLYWYTFEADEQTLFGKIVKE